MVDNTKIASLAGRTPADRSVPSQFSLEALTFLLLTGGALLLYVVTLSPTVTWGDDATLQLAAVQGRFEASAGSHPAWVGLAHLLSRLPVTEPAYGVNLASAIPAALAVGLLFATLRSLDLSLGAAATGALALAVSHTFWLHAVRAEVYALTLATEGLIVWASLQWRRTGRFRFLALSVMTIGAGLTVHVMILLCLPAVAWLVLSQHRGLRPRDWVILAFSALISLLPLTALLLNDNRRLHYDLRGLLNWAFFTFEAYDFRAQMLRFTTDTLGRDILAWLLYLGYQFAGPAFVLGWLGIWNARKGLSSRGIAVFLWLLYLGPALFALSYHVGDQFVFYLPSYLAFAIFVGLGTEQAIRWIKSRRKELSRWAPSLLMSFVLAIPVLVYWLTPMLMERYDVQFREGRFVPGAASRYFLLWPPKAGYVEARRYAEAALASAPPNALLLADPILAAPIQYIQSVERKRLDVAIHFCCWSIDEALREGTDRPIALADNDPAIYPVAQLQQQFEIEPSGSIFVLKRAAAK